MRKVVEEMFEAIPKSKCLGYLGYLNDVLLFIGAAERAAPSETTEKPS
jgi:hypothetical protein